MSLSSSGQQKNRCKYCVRLPRHKPLARPRPRKRKRKHAHTLTLKHKTLHTIKQKTAVRERHHTTNLIAAAAAINDRAARDWHAANLTKDPVGPQLPQRRRLDDGRSLALVLTLKTSFFSPPEPSKSLLSPPSSPPRLDLDLLRDRLLPPLDGRLACGGAPPGIAGMYIHAPVGGLKNMGLPSLSWACW